MDQDIGVVDCIDRASFTIVHSHCETARIPHRFQPQPVYGDIAKCRHMFGLILKNEPLFLLVIAALAFQKVEFDR